MRLLQQAFRRGSFGLRAQKPALRCVGAQQFSSDRDVEKKKTEKEFVALLRRIADAVESNESWRIQVDNERLTARLRR